MGKIETLSRLRVITPAAAAILSLMASGCGDSQPSSPAKPKPTIETTPRQPQRPKPDLVAEAVGRSLTAFRERVATRHLASVLLRACVAWHNDHNGTTVVYEPGVASATTSDGDKVHYLLDMQPDKDNPSRLLAVNGPASIKEAASGRETGNINRVFVFAEPTSRIRTVRLSGHTTHGSRIPSHYTVEGTRQPVMSTAFVPVGLAADQVGVVCGQLSAGEPIHIVFPPASHNTAPSQ